ncbi:peptidyl-prolyl cis-trans isomerase [Alteriqipengyuania sp. WL0013]|uniref:peptidylprolyl isomerase n=1 Tax=Alteriqipengyuania sp. WL0013 TaxID=3110773 RepID=UPI002CE1AF42|nr:peptidyl-prolyl cis-trans isomerase [Alteriqipengyuania sp. WL0013]MEB3414849.1 peptidyl-prolyl cis-trans isomerase [Alteriqipengyuania sp. WL0013]
MMQGFRKFFSSKIGLAITLGFLGLIALAFASADVSGSATFGGVAGGNRVAVVGDRKIGTGEMDAIVRNRVNALRRQNPELTMEEFISSGEFEALLESQFDRFAISQFAEKYGFEAGRRLVDSEIGGIDAFKGADGNFSAEAYSAVLQQQGLSDGQVRSDIADTLLLRQVLNPVAFGAQMPKGISDRYAAIFSETRTAQVLSVPAASYAPAAGPSAETLSKYYADNRSEWVRPERRVVRYATFGDATLGELPAPTNQQIAARYRRDAAQYAASEQRTVTQLVVPTRAAADAIVREVNGGTSLAQSASGKGLATAEVGPVDEEAYAEQTSEAVAEAVFAAGSGQVAAVARGPLGYYVVRVDNIRDIPARSIAEARGEISEQLAAEQRREALIQLASSIEDEIDNGSNIREIAETLGIEISTTRPITIEGRVYGTDQTAPEVIAPAIRTAFDMDTNEPQIGEIEAGTTFLLFDVADVTESSAPPLAEVREEVIARWKLDQGQAKAREVANAILKRIDGGASLANAVRAQNATLPAPRRISMTREQLTQMAREQQVGPELALMFSMARGTAKKLEERGGEGWLVINLTDVTPGEDLSPEREAAFRQQLATVLGDELAAQFRTAAREDVGVERNEDAISALRAQLLGQNAGN